MSVNLPGGFWRAVPTRAPVLGKRTLETLWWHRLHIPVALLVASVTRSLWAVSRAGGSGVPVGAGNEHPRRATCRC